MQLSFPQMTFTNAEKTTVITDCVAEIQLTYKRRIKSKDLVKVSTSKDCYEIFKSKWDLNTLDFVEQFKILMLNRANRVIGHILISTGTSVGCLVQPKLIFAAAIQSHAESLILCHNHPSGNLKPSQSDIDLTKKIKEIGKLHEIQVYDHIIISDQGYYSFADEGLL